MKLKWLALVLGLCMWLATVADASERWQSVSLPGEPSIEALGEATFPDGIRAIWVGTEQGSFRRVDGQWERWPMIEGDNPLLRAVLMAPDEDGLTTWWLATPEGLLLTRDGHQWQRRADANTSLPDNDILNLHLSQNENGQPEVWVGSRGGLTIWRMGQWESVLARPSGFQGGPVKAIRGLFHEGQRQAWVLSPDGLSRFQAGQWQRWAVSCLRGHQLNALQTLDRGERLQLIVASDRGLYQLSLDDPQSCEPLTGPTALSGPVAELARDRHERLYALIPGRVERFSPDPGSDWGWRWTFFDHRDDLPEGINWRGGHRLDADGRLWVGSDRGLWSLNPREPSSEPEARPALKLSDGRQSVAPNADSPLSIRQTQPALTLLPETSERPHSLRFRFRLSPDTAFEPWQADQSFSPGPLAAGQHRIGVEMADEFGRVHGVYEFSVARGWPLTALIAMVLAGLLVSAALIFLIFRSR